MIPFDFAYYKPADISEAVKTFKELHSQGKSVVYYSGGTEFITFARLNHLTAEAVIDLKGIPECNVMEVQGDHLMIGSAVSLNKITEANLFPLLGQTVKKIADHTSRNKITIGGNLNSRLIYREGLLALLLSDAKVKISGTDGEKMVLLKDVYEDDWRLNPEEFIVQLWIDKGFIGLPFVSLKKTRASKVGYPIVSVAALVKDQYIRTAISGVYGFPFRSHEIETVLNDSTLTIKERVNKASSLLPGPILDDMEASREYREFVFKNILQETLETLEAAQ